MALTCKNCGGRITFDAKSKMISCESCGSTQPLNHSLDTNQIIYENDDITRDNISTYYRAVNLMAGATKIDTLQSAKSMFERIPDTLNSYELARECQDAIELLKTEQDYQQAICDMQSAEPEKIMLAQGCFVRLGGYRDSSEKAKECTPLIEQAEIFKEQERKKEIARKTRRTIKIRILVAVAIIVALAVMLVNGYIHSDSRYEIKIQPVKEGYLINAGSRYKFLYDFEIQNNGVLDVSVIECDVVIERDDNVIVDTRISFSNHSSAALRAGKKSHFNWELTTDSEYTARELYNNFDELDISVNIVRIQFSNGEIKTY